DQLTMEIERYRREISAGETTHEQRMKLIELEKRLGDEKRKVGEFEVQQLSRINNIRERGERDRQKAVADRRKAEEDYQKLLEFSMKRMELDSQISKLSDTKSVLDFFTASMEEGEKISSTAVEIVEKAGISVKRLNSLLVSSYERQITIIQRTS